MKYVARLYQGDNSVCLGKLYPAFRQYGNWIITDENSDRIVVVVFHMEHFIDSTDLYHW